MAVRRLFLYTLCLLAFFFSFFFFNSFTSFVMGLRGTVQIIREHAFLICGEVGGKFFYFYLFLSQTGYRA